MYLLSSVGALESDLGCTLSSQLSADQLCDCERMI